MRFYLIHVDDRPGGAGEEVTLLVPGGLEKTAIVAPLDGLAPLLGLLHEETQHLDRQCCPACAAPLPMPRAEEADAA